MGRAAPPRGRRHQHLRARQDWLRRASTLCQSLDTQLDALAAAGITQIFSEKLSTRATARPELQAAVALARQIRAAGVAVTLVVHEHKRLGRGLALIELAEDLRAADVGLEFLSGDLQGSHDPSGVVFTVLAALSGMEREYSGPQDFTLAGGVVRTKKGQVIPVIVTGVRRAVATDLCTSALVSTPAGTITIRITIRITGGRDGNEVTIEDLVIDVAAAQSAATLRDVELGRDASTLDGVPAARGPAGSFGGQSSTFTLRNTRLSAWAVTAATLSLPDLGLKVLRGEHECF
ncbi:DUF6230 family protein [Streptosporangium sp. NPDC051023]|uniref:DUF6230 family protein n=1 Tax=Streptosporangium sp. NPDC051023 TaxID=3155410 RepID=UPI00344DDADD